MKTFNQQIHMIIFGLTILCCSCGVKTDPIPPEGQFLPNPTAPYFNDLPKNQETEDS